MNYAALIKGISTATTQLQGRAAAALNQALVIRNWMVGAWIVEFEQTGKDRAKYRARLLDRLADDLALRSLKGLDLRTLRDCRRLATLYPQIRGTVSPELPSPLEPAQVMRLSWSQLLELIRIDDPWKRAFFENECLDSRWPVRQLQRQIGSLLYERTGLSANKKAVIERARKQAPQESIAGLLRDPYVLEFANLAEGMSRPSASCCAATRMAPRSNSPRPAWIKNCSSRATSPPCPPLKNCARFSKQTASGLKAACLRPAAQPNL